MNERRIFKYSINLQPYEYPDVRMPSESQIIHVGAQEDALMIWAIVDPSRPEVRRRLYVVGTGQYIPPEGRHVGTAQVGAFVWHVFDGGDI